MADLIDREATLKKMCEMCNFHTSPDFACRKCNVYEMIAVQPTIDVAPVRHGRWILKILPIGGGDKIRSYLCSECDRYANMKFDYCPNCGADMRGGAKK